MSELPRPLPPPPDCEFTAPDAETEAVDCWAPATKRRVSDGVTVGVFCDEHSEPGDEDMD